MKIILLEYDHSPTEYSGMVNQAGLFHAGRPKCPPGKGAGIWPAVRRTRIFPKHVPAVSEKKVRDLLNLIRVIPA